MGCSVSKASRLVSGQKRLVHPESQSPASASATSLLSSQQTEQAFASGAKMEEILTIVHFNDVYNVEEGEKEPIGGAARFKTKVDSLQRLNPLVVFSGDALNPSNLSTVTQGEHMVPVLNSIGVHVALYGNHEFDFGIDHLVSVMGKTNFPWLISNVKDKMTGGLLAEGRESVIIPWQGRKIGFIGLIEWEWLVTLATIEPDEVEYIDFVECARHLLPQLQSEGCDLLVAVTHMRLHNDIRLAVEVPELHLILGGHDHHYEKKWIGDTLLLKSGSDFREFSQISITFSQPCPIFEVIKHEITRDIPPDPELQAVISRYSALVEEGMQEEIGSIDCDLEGRFSYIRTQETNLGNLVTDIMRRVTRSDIALLNSGTFRSDAIHEAGRFRVKDLMAILPMFDPLAVMEVTGEQLLLALENGVSQYPRHEGRFPQVSGVSFTFDPSQPSGSRVSEYSVLVGGERVQRDKTYTLCTKGYIASGKDGYGVFKQAKTVLSFEDGPILNSIVRNHFTSCSQQESHSRVELSGEFTRINPKVEGRIMNISSG